jgi:hypothetical protein
MQAERAVDKPVTLAQSAESRVCLRCACDRNFPLLLRSSFPPPRRYRKLRRHVDRALLKFPHLTNAGCRAVRCGAGRHRPVSTRARMTPASSAMHAHAPRLASGGGPGRAGVRIPPSPHPPDDEMNACTCMWNEHAVMCACVRACVCAYFKRYFHAHVCVRAYLCTCVCVACVRACVLLACVRACVRVCVRACVLHVWTSASAISSRPKYVASGPRPRPSSGFLRNASAGADHAHMGDIHVRAHTRIAHRHTHTHARTM